MIDRERRSIRLPDFDYASDGGYFLAICVYQRVCLFGDVIDDEMRLSELGQIVQEEWLRTAIVRPYVMLDEFIIMPNHVHAVLFLNAEQADSGLQNQQGKPTVGATCQVAPTHPRGPKSGSIGAIIGQFKRITTIRVNEHREQSCARLWQRNYYEHVIRNESSLNDIRSYIQTNPARWAEDAENPANLSR